jgi:hypothetical protein
VNAVFLQDVIHISDTRIRLIFSDTLESIRAEYEPNYAVRGTEGNVGISSAVLIGGRTVELRLVSRLNEGEQYTVTAADLRTLNGVTFSDENTFIYGNGDISFSTTINGMNAVPTASTVANGTGIFTLTQNGLEYDITLNSINVNNIVGAYFRRGPSGTIGPILEVIPMTSLRSTGTWSNLTADERADLMENNIYVNVQTYAYPQGEIRGQLIRQ